MTGGYTLINSVADALVLQCYESESMSAFGRDLTMEHRSQQNRDLSRADFAD